MMSEVSIAKLAKEAVELKKRFDDIAQKVNDLDIFMREAVMVMIDIINNLHATIDELEKRADIIEAILMGEEPIDVLRRKKEEVPKEEKPPLEVLEKVPEAGPKPPSTPPPQPSVPPTQHITQQTTQISQAKLVSPSTQSLPQQLESSTLPTPQEAVSQQPQVIPQTPVQPQQQASMQSQVSAPSPVSSALPPRAQLILQLKQALASRRKKK